MSSMQLSRELGFRRVKTAHHSQTGGGGGSNKKKNNERNDRNKYFQYTLWLMADHEASPKCMGARVCVVGGSV